MRCLGTLLIGLILLVLAGVAWLKREELRERWRDLAGYETEAVESASPQLAEAANEKIDRLRNGDDTRIALSAAEVESLLRFSHAGLLPAFVDSPRVRLDDDRLSLSARLPTRQIPGLDDLGRAASLLPDTTTVEVVGRLFPLDSEHATFAIDGIQIADIPLPDRLVPRLLDQLGRSANPSLPADALAVPLPPGAHAIYVRADSLVLVSRTGNGRS